MRVRKTAEIVAPMKINHAGVRSGWATVLIGALTLASIANAIEQNSFVKSRDLEVGKPPRFLIQVRPTYKDPTGSGMEAWYGRLDVRPVSNGKIGRVLFSVPDNSGLKLVSAKLVPDLISGKPCLWVVYQVYGWSDPHVMSNEGELLLVEDGKLKPIWRTQVLAENGGAGTGYKSTANVEFSQANGPLDSNYHPTITVTDQVWATTQLELESLPAKPKQTAERIYAFNGRQFKLMSGVEPPVVQ